MGDPGLVAGDLVGVAVFYRAGLERAEVRAGVRLCEDSGWQDVARRDRREVFFLLRVRAANEDQLCRDLRSCAERAGADIAPAELFGDDAHACLAEAEAAKVLRDGEAEDAELCHLLDNRHRDIGVLKVPFMGVRHDPFGRKTAELVADHGESFVEAGLFHRGARQRIGQVFRGGGHGFGRLALGQEALDGRFEQALHALLGDADVSGADDLALVHRDAADQLGAIF